MKKVLLNVLLVGIVLLAGMITQVRAQERTISGTVKAADSGNSMPGVNVFVKGTTIGTATDTKGHYSLQVPASADTLVFSYIGYIDMDVAINKRSVINVKLKPSVQQFKDVVVTAFGIKRQQRAIGYSAQSVSTKGMTTDRSSNFVNDLQGKIAGVNITSSSGAVGSSTRITLRGVSSLAGNNQPLFIVDGVPIDNSTFTSYGGYGGIVDYGNAAMDIDPNNIKSITVLKGPNAAALYGSRAANGAIIITTKSGASRKGKGVGVTASSSVTFQRVAVLPDLQNQYGQGQYGQFKYVDGKGGGTYDEFDESWGPRLNIGLMIPQFDSPVVNGVRQATPWVSHPNNISSYFNTGHTITNNFSVAGASKQVNYRLAFTNLGQTGTIPNSSLDRDNLSLNAGYQVNKKFRVEGNITYIRLIGKNRPANGYSALNPMQQLTQWIGRQVNMNSLRHYMTPSGQQINWNHLYHNNVFWETYQDFDRQDRNRMIGRVQASYDFNSWLKLRAYTGSDIYSERRTRGVAANDITNIYGNYSNHIYNVRETTSDIILSMDKDLNQNFHLSAMVGGERVYTHHAEVGGYIDKLSVPGVYNLNNGQDPISPLDYIYNKRVNSIYGSATLGFKDYLYLDVTGRNDWSSTLPLNNNSYFYPSVSLSYVFTDGLGITSSWLSYGKIRASWTRVGNDTQPYQLQTVYNSAGRFGSLPTYVLSGTIPNLNLKPESTTSWEIGGNLKFFDNRIGIDLTYYNRQTTQQILGVQIDGASGFTNQFINAGDVANKGIEATLDVTPVQTQDFRWNFTVNWAKNDNKVLRLAPGVHSYILGSAWGVTSEARPGGPIGTIWGYGWARDSKGHILVGSSTNGQPLGIPIGTNKIHNYGSYQPKWTGSFYNTFSYKNLSFSFLIALKQGGKLFSVTNMFGDYTGILTSDLYGRQSYYTSNGTVVVSNPIPGFTGKVGSDGKYHVQVYKGEPKPNFLLKNAYYGVKDKNGNWISSGQPNTTVMTAQHFGHWAWYGYAGPNVYDASYVKLRSVELTYSLPRKWVHRTPFTKIDVSLIARNPLIISRNSPNIDPETAFGAGNLQGFESNQIPSVRSFGFSVSLSL